MTGTVATAPDMPTRTVLPLMRGTTWVRREVLRWQPANTPNSIPFVRMSAILG